MLASKKPWNLLRTDFTSRRGVGYLPGFALLLACGLAGAPTAIAADLAEAEKLFRTGRYDECVRLVDDEIANMAWSESWRHLKIRSQLATGKYSEAIASLEEALRRFPERVFRCDCWAATSIA